MTGDCQRSSPPRVRVFEVLQSLLRFTLKCRTTVARVARFHRERLNSAPETPPVS